MEENDGEDRKPSETLDIETKALHLRIQEIHSTVFRIPSRSPTRTS